jgi:hypothetical protein
LPVSSAAIVAEIGDTVVISNQQSAISNQQSVISNTRTDEIDGLPSPKADAPFFSWQEAARVVPPNMSPMHSPDWLVSQCIAFVLLMLMTGIID